MTNIAPPSPRGYVLAADQGLAADRPDLKASAGSTGGQLTVFTLSVDGGPPRHTHTREDESIYLFSGLLEVECDGEEFEAAPGSFVFLPRERPHVQERRRAPPAGSSSPPAGWRTTSTPCMPPSRPATRPRSERSRPSTASARRDGKGRLGRPPGSEPARWRPTPGQPPADANWSKTAKPDY
jgi:mannose-6-phosphate isomerase-like protein (cupin superfamily)